MLRSKVAFRIRQKHNRQGTIKPTKLNTVKLSTISHREIIEQEMDSVLAQWEEKENSTPDEEWAAVQQVVYNTAKTYLGKPERKHQVWFDPNGQELQTYQQKRPSPSESVANQEHSIHPPLQHIKMPADCYKNAPVLVGKEGSGGAGSC
ncbi:hypothetical protein NP493_564g03054 [Ridgeia piscesae]|uniref:Uncharacterized protein n=1 Tax=Ridgeia piscesae TaxID=27915 RepID=A0AAD9KUS7_RIDPI|nr:hypothetical protein NP493_564g03054 [Ridgeia piscesae]